jgi:hypothetical protein
MGRRRSNAKTPKSQERQEEAGISARSARRDLDLLRRPWLLGVLALTLLFVSPAYADGSGSGSAMVIQLPPDANAPEVSAAASPSEVRLGSRFTLFVTAVFNDGVEVNLREPVELGGAFEIKRRLSEDKARADGKHVREWQLDVYAWELGELQVPPVAVTFTVGGKAAQVATNPVPIRVVGTLGEVVDDPKLMRSNAAPVSLVSRDWFWIWVSIGVGSSLVILTVAILVRRGRRRRVVRLVADSVVAIRPRRIDMTSERALEQLLAVERSGVLDRDDERKSGYAQMVDVIRDYLGARYRVATLDLTTSELVRALAKAAPEHERTLVEAWLERCDLVKYGGFRATADDGRAVLADARGLVVATTAPAAREAA